MCQECVRGTERAVLQMLHAEAADPVREEGLPETGKCRPKKQVSHHVKIALEAIKDLHLKNRDND